MDEIVTRENAAEVKKRIHAEAALLPSQSWYYVNFESVDAAVTWLNLPPRQSAGEVTATARNDGTVGMLTILPPTAPLQLQQWAFQNFPSTNDAVTFLNQARESDGEASATLRRDGSVGVFYITPA